MVMNPPSISNSYQRRDFGNPIIQIFLSVVVLVLFSIFILKPKITQTYENKAKLAAAKSQLTQIEKDQKELNTLVNKLKSSPEEVALIDEALPLSGRVSKAYVLMESLVNSSGMDLSLIDSSDTSKFVSAGEKEVLANPYKAGRELHTITLNTSINGTMEQFRNLLQLIETNGRVLDVESVEINGGEALTKFMVTIKAYAYGTK
jgi:Tfp pilus assembly protein PilO